MGWAALAVAVAVVVAVLATPGAADVDPGEIGLQFFGNEFAYTEEVPNFPTLDLSLTLRIKASSGHLLSYGVQGGQTFDPSQLVLSNVESLKISRGSGTEWSTGANFADGDWHSLGLTWRMSTGETKLYKDGVEVGSAVLSKGSPLSVGGHLLFGQRQNCAVGCFTKGEGLIGTVADVTLWKRALTANQMEYLSTNAPSGDETDLVTFLPLNEKDSLQGPDKASGGNDVFLGGPSWSSDVGMGGASTSLALHKQGALVLTPANDFPTGDFTVEFWIKTSVLEDMTILSFFNEGADVEYPFVIHNPALLTVVHGTEVMRTDTSVATGAWNHVALTWQQESGRLKLYKNGGLAYPPAWLPEADYDMMPTLDKGGSLAQPKRVTLGGKVTCTTGSCLDVNAGFDGVLQEVRVWSVVRTQTEVEEWKDKALSTDPLPDNLALYWKLDHKGSERLAVDSAARGNDAYLTRPMWKNTLVAPPFPTLDDVNKQVVAMKEQMNDLLEYVKEVMEPNTDAPTDDKPFTVQDEGKCDRRYKYLCTTKLQDVQAPEQGEAAADNGGGGGGGAEQQAVNVNVLVQRALSHNAIKQPHLTEQLAPKVHAKTRAVLERPSAAANVASRTNRAPSSALHAAALVQTTQVAAGPAVVASPSHERKRHAWATAAPVPVSPQSLHNGHQAKAVLQEPSHKRHAWAAGAVATNLRSLARQGVAEFLQEDEDVVDKDDSRSQPSRDELDDLGPEVMARRRLLTQGRAQVQAQAQAVPAEHAPSSPAGAEDDGKDFDALQREFEEQERKFKNFEFDDGHDFPDPWNFDGAYPDATAARRAADQRGLLQEALQEDEGTSETIRRRPHHHHEGPQHAQGAVEFAAVDNDHHHHHHHHEPLHHHHHSRHSPTPHHRPRHAEASKVSSGDVAAPALVSRQQLVKGATESANDDDEAAAAAVAPSVAAPRAVANGDKGTPARVGDDGGVGGKYEQLVMPGAESEWDEAIAEGIGNSDMANDDIGADAVSDIPLPQ